MSCELRGALEAVNSARSHTVQVLGDSAEKHPGLCEYIIEFLQHRGIIAHDACRAAREVTLACQRNCNSWHSPSATKEGKVAWCRDSSVWRLPVAAVGATNACQVDSNGVPRLPADEAAALELLLGHNCPGTRASIQRLVTPQIRKSQMQAIEALTTAAAEEKPNSYKTTVAITNRHAITRSCPSSSMPTDSNTLRSLQASEEAAVVMQKDYNSGQSRRVDEQAACTDSTVCLTPVAENAVVTLQQDRDAREVPVPPTKGATVAWCSDCDALQSPILVERVLAILTENSTKTSMSKNCLAEWSTCGDETLQMEAVVYD